MAHARRATRACTWWPPSWRFRLRCTLRRPGAAASTAASASLPRLRSLSGSLGGRWCTQKEWPRSHSFQSQKASHIKQRPRQWPHPPGVPWSGQASRQLVVKTGMGIKWRPQSSAVALLQRRSVSGKHGHVRKKTRLDSSTMETSCHRAHFFSGSCWTFTV